MVEIPEKAGSNKTLQTVAHPLLGVSRGTVPCSRTSVNYWCNQQHEKHWQEGDASSTNNEKVSTEYAIPIWNEVVTKAWCNMLDLGGVQPSKMLDLGGVQPRRRTYVRDKRSIENKCGKHEHV